MSDVCMSSSTKRAADSTTGGPSAKKGVGQGVSAGGMAGAAGGAGSKGETNPIPRPMKRNRMTFTFTKCTFDEITSDLVSYFPGAFTLCNLFPTRQTDIVANLAELFPLMSIHPLKFKMSNFVFLLDEVGALGSTPVTTTSITPQMYFLHMRPDDQTQTSIQIRDDDNKLLTFTTQIPDVNTSTLLTNDATFNANVENWALRTPGTASTFQDGGKVGPINASVMSGTPRVPRVADRKQFSIVRPGDAITKTYSTAVNKTLLATKIDYFRTIVSGATPSFTTTYYHYPGRFRPLLYRDEMSNPTLAEKHPELGSCTYDFFVCPPIAKGDGTILKQRVACMTEIEMSITLYNREDYYAVEGTHDANLSQFGMATWNPSTQGTAAVGDGSMKQTTFWH
uniref:VP n=1 Tax=Lanius cristatus densovirus TaxID=2794498 RepID=A0A8A4XC77_9VIRU|nr:MAG: VP [Lanius cristatus densovirus]